MKTLLCSPENPYTEERAKLNPDVVWCHEDSHEVGDSDDVATWKCDTCGTTWQQELPQ